MSPELGIHVLIKLTNAEGDRLGECVVTLSQLASPDCLDHFVEGEVNLPCKSCNALLSIFFAAVALIIWWTVKRHAQGAL